MFNFTKIAAEPGINKKEKLTKDELNKFHEFILNKPEIKKLKEEYVNRFDEIDQLLLQEIKKELPKSIYDKNEEIIKGLLFINKITTLSEINLSSRFDNFIKFKLFMTGPNQDQPSWLDFDLSPNSFYEENIKDSKVIKYLSKEIIKECNLNEYQADNIYHGMRRIFNTLISPIDSYLISQDKSEGNNFFTNSLTEFLENS